MQINGLGLSTCGLTIREIGNLLREVCNNSRIHIELTEEELQMFAESFSPNVWARFAALIGWRGSYIATNHTFDTL